MEKEMKRITEFADARARNRLGSPPSKKKSTGSGTDKVGGREWGRGRKLSLLTPEPETGLIALFFTNP